VTLLAEIFAAGAAAVSPSFCAAMAEILESLLLDCRPEKLKPNPPDPDVDVPGAVVVGRKLTLVVATGNPDPVLVLLFDDCWPKVNVFVEELGLIPKGDAVDAGLSSPAALFIEPKMAAFCKSFPSVVGFPLKPNKNPDDGFSAPLTFPPSPNRPAEVVAGFC